MTRAERTAEPLIARTGRWFFRHRWTTVALWIVAAVVGALASGPLFANLSDDGGPASLESVQAQRVLDRSGQSAGTVVGVVRGVDPHTPKVQATVTSAAADLARISGVRGVTTPYGAGAGTDRIAQDGRGLLIDVTLGDLADSPRTVTAAAIADRLHALAPALATDGAPGATVLVGGDPLVNDQANARAQHDLSRAEELSLPITLVVLAFVFGGVVAAGLPVLAAIASIAGSLIVLSGFAQVTSLDQNAVTVVTLLGLGLSIDYGLLLVARYRDERAAGLAPDDAVARAWATAGRTIVFSALTVAASLSGMLVFGISALSSLGAAGVSIALVAMATALTLTAALLGFAGRRIRPSKRATATLLGSDRGFFGNVAGLVARRPLTVAAATGGALVAAGLPLLSMTVHVDGTDGLPRSLESVRVIDVLHAAFPQTTPPAVTVVARTDPATLDRWARTFADRPEVSRIDPASAVAPGLSVVDVAMTGDPEGPAAVRLVDAMRADRPDAQSWVTGEAAVHRDVLDRIGQRLPWAVGLTFATMVALLFTMTGSLVVPLKAALIDVVSLGATFGVLDAVFEHGVLAGPLHITPVSGISPFVIVTVFAFAFGLSMDYEVFLLARIKEQVDRGYPTGFAVRAGLQRSGRIITSAALLMVVVFGCFVTGRIGNIQQIGFGLAVAVAIDATIVRCVLVPATMTVLDRWNWWAPAPLARLHRQWARRLVEPAAPEPVGSPAVFDDLALRK